VFSSTDKGTLSPPNGSADKTELNIEVKVIKQGRGQNKFVLTRKAKRKPQQ